MKRALGELSTAYCQLVLFRHGPTGPKLYELEVMML
jgi:hypothetical protein